MSEPLIMRVAPPAPRSRDHHRDHTTTFGALIASVFYAIDALVIGGTTCPGLLLCVPAILLVIAPLILIGTLLLSVAVVAAAAATPVVLAAKLVNRHRTRVAAAATVRHVPRPVVHDLVHGGIVRAATGERHA